ncbi:unnamed protein product, partial [Protopolystoma xenopodis]
MCSSRSKISSKALTAFSPEIFVYIDCTSKLTNSSDTTDPMLINRVNDSFRIRSASNMSSSRSKISSKALTAFSPEMFVY